MAVLREADLAPLTTFGLPARAERLAVCTSVEDIRLALTVAREESLPLTILGWGITDGAHELTLSYVWKTPSHLRSRPHRVLPCAEF